jgi:hypothetical protein
MGVQAWQWKLQERRPCRSSGDQTTSFQTCPDPSRLVSYSGTEGASRSPERGSSGSDARSRRGSVGHIGELDVRCACSHCAIGRQLCLYLPEMSVADGWFVQMPAGGNLATLEPKPKYRKLIVVPVESGAHKLHLKHCRSRQSTGQRR